MLQAGLGLEEVGHGRMGSGLRPITSGEADRFGSPTGSDKPSRTDDRQTSLVDAFVAAARQFDVAAMERILDESYSGDLISLFG